MSNVRFDELELMLMAMFEQPTLKDTIQVLTEVQTAQGIQNRLFRTAAFLLLALLPCLHQFFHIGNSLLHQLIIPEIVDGVDVLALHFIVHDQLIHSNKAAIFLDAESNALVGVHPFGRNLVVDFQRFFHRQMVVELSCKRKL